jgi:hypothetical protein
MKNVPEYIIKIDNDINANKNMLDDMYDILKKTDDSIAYCYPPFKYILPNKQEISFSGRFDKNRLLQGNYITSNSLIKYDKLKEIGGFVCDKKYERLLDYCLWLKFLRYGYIGIECNKGFITPLNENNVSARGQEDFKDKMNMVRQDFILPYF